MKRISVLCLAMLMVCVIAPSAVAQNVLVDRIIAVVNQDVVLHSEVESRYAEVQARYRANPNVLPPEADLRAQILDALILEKVQVQKAQEAGITITDAALNSALTDIASRQGLDLLAFRQALTQQGMSYDAVRAQVRQDLMIRQAQQRYVARQIDVSTAEINQYLQTQISAALQDIEYQLQHLLIPASEADAEATARRIAAAINNDGRTLDVAAAGRTLQNLGWRRPEALPSLLSEPVRGLTVGAARVFSSPNGWHVVYLQDQRGNATQTVVEYRARHILLNESRGLTDAAAQALASDLYTQLTEENADFAELARLYSVDGSAEQGGDLGWNAANVYVAEFAQTLRDTPINAYSRPFRTAFGWHILQVQDTRETDQTLTALREKARDILFEQKYSEALPRWQQEVRNSAYVNVRVEP
ncbi:peptidylprolyl isomerase [Salinispirillum marinum]|uniref:Chaperone SurA n=2 Tax=Saccharospirillaceae TaxID=255527 RepID=A0ABV8BBT3_9GAMM